MGPARALPTLLARSLEGAERLAVLAVGSELRGDDAAGILVALRLQRIVSPRSAKLRLFVGATAPENLTGEIRRFAPTHLVIVDAADFGSRPGAVRLIDPDRVTGATFCTHQLPPTLLIDYLRRSLSCRVLIVGIQPGSLEVGGGVSRTVARAAASVASALRDALR